MLRDALYNKTKSPLIMRMLDTTMLRHRVISNNIANVTTDGYRRVEVSFEEQLRLALDKSRVHGTKTSGRHMDIGGKNLNSVQAYAYRPADPSLPSGVNNVDIDMEMAKLAENQIQFNYANKFISGLHKKLNAAISAKPVQ